MLPDRAANNTAVSIYCKDKVEKEKMARRIKKSSGRVTRHILMASYSSFEDSSQLILPISLRMQIIRLGPTIDLPEGLKATQECSFLSLPHYFLEGNFQRFLFRYFEQNSPCVSECSNC